MATIKPVSFNRLPEIDENDGKVILHDGSQLGRSTKELGEIIDDRLRTGLEDGKQYAMTTSGWKDVVIPEVDLTPYAYSAGLEADKQFVMTDNGWAEVDLSPYALSADVDSKAEEISAWANETFLTAHQNLDDYATKNWVEEQNYITGVDLSNYYTKLETSAASAISDALALKEDKVFVAEYDVTTYQELLDAYNAGKQIACNYYPYKESLPTYVIVLKFNEYSPIQGLFKFSVQTANNVFKYVQCTFNDGNTSNTTWHEETTLLQEELTFAGENNTITAINSSAVGGGTEYTAGTDLNIVDDVIKVNTNGSVGDPNWYSFVEGDGTVATGYAAHAEGYCTTANTTASHSEGGYTYANGDYSHAEGYSSSAIGYAAHAEGGGYDRESPYTHRGTLAIGKASHSEGYGTSAIGDYTHAEGYSTIAGDSYMHAGGKYNKTSVNALFVIGNGTSTTRSDAFIIYPDGGVSAAGNISANGVELGGGSTINLIGEDGIQVSSDAQGYHIGVSASSELNAGAGIAITTAANATTISLSGNINSLMTLLENKPATGQSYMIGIDSNGNLTWLTM